MDNSTHFLDKSASPPEFDAESILFHGGGLLVVDKRAGIPVHRGTGHPFGVIESLEEWVRSTPGILDIRPGGRIHAANRLELETSGVLVLALKKARARELKEALASRRVPRRYLAVLAGPVAESGRLEGKVRSKLRGPYRRLPASLTYRRLAGDERLSLIEVIPEEGRTHFVRALFADAGRPLAGDLRYGRPKPSEQFLERFGLSHHLLHAFELRLPADILGAERIFRALPPASYRSLCEQKGWCYDRVLTALDPSGSESTQSSSGTP